MTHSDSCMSRLGTWDASNSRQVGGEILSFNGVLKLGQGMSSKNGTPALMDLGRFDCPPKSGNLEDVLFAEC